MNNGILKIEVSLGNMLLDDGSIDGRGKRLAKDIVIDAAIAQ